MYKYKKPLPTTLVINKSYVGERIEEKVNRILNNKEPIRDGAPLIFTDRKEGVLAATNIRTDRFEVAVEAMDKIQKSKIAKREEKAKSIGETAKENMTKEAKNETGGQSTHGTAGTGDPK